MPKRKRYQKLHANGTVWGRGWMAGKFMVGPWTWYRKDGTKLRSGFFDHGTPVGKWVTYDRRGRVYKVTLMKVPRSGTAERNDSAA